MRRLRSLLLRVVAPPTRSRGERDVAAEIEGHLQLHIDDNLRAGMTPDEARRCARLALGGVEQTKERVRDARGTFLDSIRQDVVFALRLVRRSPVASAVAILSLALGIGANTAIFSVLDSLLLRSLPVREPERLVLLTEGDTPTFTNPVWEEIRNRRLFAGAFAWQATRFDLARTGEVEPVDGMWASGAIFDVLGVPALLGRTLTETDDVRGGGPHGPVAVLSYRLWQRRFGGAADVSFKGRDGQWLPAVKFDLPWAPAGLMVSPDGKYLFAAGRWKSAKFLDELRRRAEGDAPQQDAGRFTDTRDSRVYRTVRIAGRTWMAEYLA